MPLQLPPLKYEFNSLEPFMDAKTVEIHRTKHHQGYVDKLNKALENYPDLQNKTTEELIKNLNQIPEEIRTAVRNNGCQHLNHDLFFEILKRDISPSGEILRTINKIFGSFDNFKTQFSEKSLVIFGSGWCWLAVDNKTKKLEIIQTQNEATPIMQNKTPVLVIDVWEHAYYLKYQNRRPEFIENFFKIINWNKVNELYLEAMD